MGAPFVKELDRVPLVNKRFYEVLSNGVGQATFAEAERAVTDYHHGTYPQEKVRIIDVRRDPSNPRRLVVTAGIR